MASSSSSPAGGEPLAAPAADATASILTTEHPPRSVLGILSRLGPGLIIAGAIVGSGELIATTSTGAVAGFSLLWLIVIGCVIKVFTQVELGRFTIVNGRTTMEGLNEVPGPRLGRANWLLWYWLIMFVVSLAQLGGIIGGVSQALSMAAPVRGDFNQLLDDQAAYAVEKTELTTRLQAEAGEETILDPGTIAAAVADKLGPPPREKALPEWVAESLGWQSPNPGVVTFDDKFWATLITIITMGLLVVGRYHLIQTVSIVMVAGFTLVTIVNLVALQTRPELAITGEDLWQGLTFQLPSREGLAADVNPLAVALMTFGIIGVGGTELIQYPYWCLEKGYARFTGPRDDSAAWAERARGWLKVLQWDAWCSMLVYTFATIAFYLLGASVLHRLGQNPEGNQMIRVLSEMYQDVFGSWAGVVFLSGAFAVLYSTFFVATASHARVASDAVRVFGAGARTPEAQRWWTVAFSAGFPLLCLFFFLVYPKPQRLVLASGMMQAILLPMLGAACLYFRYYRSDQRLLPGRGWDLMLWVSAGGLLLAGLALLALQILPLLGVDV